MWKDIAQVDKYQYVRTSPYLIRFMGVLGACASLLMGYGFWSYLNLNIFYLIIFGPIVFFLITNKFLRFLIQLFYPRFDIKKHEEFINDYWDKNPEPSIDIFLPYAGEEIEVHEAVVKAAVNLNYKNYRVYMLDDSGRDDHKKLAKKYGCIHLSRPNKGEYKKSGNLEYGYAHSEGEYIFILDADFIPAPNALKDMIPYMAQDKQIGILQTPQYFEQTDDVHNRSRIEFGGGNIVEDFYRIILPCRDEFRAGMCVGTSALYRRTAIEKLHGTPKVHASEDLATGLLITQHGFYVKYLPLIESIGTSPDSFQSYFKQHLRWCSGNLVFAKYWPTARMSLMARLIYLVNPMYYLSEALSVIFCFQFLILLYFHNDSLSIFHTLYFLPYIIVSKIMIPVSKINKGKIGTKLAALNNSYTYFYTFITMVTKSVPAWHPTGLKISGVSSDFLENVNIGIGISSIYIALFIYVIVSKPDIFGNYNAYAVLAWSFYSVFWHVAYLTMVARSIHQSRVEEVPSKTRRLFMTGETHFLATLCLLLFLSATFNATVTLQKPNTPTAIAIAKFSGQNPEPEISTIAQAQVAAETPQLATPEVLSATAQYVPAEPQDITFIIKTGDTYSKLAEKAVLQYDSSLTKAQSTYASYKIINSLEERQKLTPGKEITFTTEQLSTSIAAAKEFKK